jgi:hypothetical protein
MSKIALAIVAATVAAGPLWLPAPARAENGQIAAGVVGGLIGGALLGGALAARPAPPPVYYAPEPVYIEEPQRLGSLRGRRCAHDRCRSCDRSPSGRGRYGQNVPAGNSS